MALANRLAHEVLGRCFDELAPQTRRLLDVLDGFINQRAEEGFGRRELRERPRRCTNLARPCPCPTPRRQQSRHPLMRLYSAIGRGVRLPAGGDVMRSWTTPIRFVTGLASSFEICAHYIPVCYNTSGPRFVTL